MFVNQAPLYYDLKHGLPPMYNELALLMQQLSLLSSRFQPGKDLPDFSLDMLPRTKVSLFDNAKKSILICQVSFVKRTVTNAVMETIITKQLLTFLETNNLLSDHQYGFRKARSTGDLLAYAVHVWSSALESSGESRVISLDISKAFDRVWHKDLLAKLPMFGLHHTLINWIW